MEFKFDISPTTVQKILQILIESQWNLNLDFLLALSAQIGILIESQWNLNSINLSFMFLSTSILIESQWNLNAFNCASLIISVLNINRITVEFK